MLSVDLVLHFYILMHFGGEPLESLHRFTSMLWSSTSSNIFLRVNGGKLFMFYLLGIILILLFSLVYGFDNLKILR